MHMQAPGGFHGTMRTIVFQETRTHAILVLRPRFCCCTLQRDIHRANRLLMPPLLCSPLNNPDYRSVQAKKKPTTKAKKPTAKGKETATKGKEVTAKGKETTTKAKKTTGAKKPASKEKNPSKAEKPAAKKKAAPVSLSMSFFVFSRRRFCVAAYCSHVMLLLSGADLVEFPRGERKACRFPVSGASRGACLAN